MTPGFFAWVPNRLFSQSIIITSVPRFNLHHYTEQEFDLGHIKLQARVWGREKCHKVIALHGWLDNCASFNRIAPLMDAHVVALDLAGHGLSDHRKHLAPYNLWEDIAEVFAVADALQWQEFSLLGHSRGAMVATLAAGTFPKRIKALSLIDGIWPEPVNEEDAPRQLAQSVAQVLNPRRKRATVYPSWDAAIEARMNSIFPIARESSELLAERGVLAHEGGYIWRADPNLQLPSAIKLTRNQQHAFVHKIEAQCNLILAENGISHHVKNLREELNHFPKISVTLLDGSHHLHMETRVNEVADAVNQLFSQLHS